jgi:ABC-2 type transport system ATP-binding protein
MNVIQTEKLSKSFENFVAVDDISINVREGEIYGFLGLNGAGKTTTIRLLLGMIKPSSGSIALMGQEAKQASPFWNNVGYMVETPYAYPNLTVKENLQVFYTLRALRNKKQIDNIIEVLQLGKYINTRAKHLSLGNNQRLGLAKALIHNPRLLILDEPINGLDPAGIVQIRQFLKDLVKNHNTTILISSHILSEISNVATRIGIIHNGRLIKEINTNELEHHIIKKLCINTSDNSNALEILKEKYNALSINGSGIIETGDPKAINRPEEISSHLCNKGLPPKMLHVYEEDLEAYFLRVINN